MEPESDEKASDVTRPSVSNADAQKAAQPTINAIAEAILEIRFSGSTVLADLAIGRLSANPRWQGFTPVRLPFADIPFPIRKADENLQFQPTVELRSADGSHAVKLGDSALSYHAFKYPGWAVFQKELDETAQFLFKTMGSITATRLGLRYVNLFTKSEHQIDRPSDLKLRIVIGGKNPPDPFLLAYNDLVAADLQVTVKVGSRDFVQNATKPNATAVLDIDAYTPGRHKASTAAGVMSWVERAHDAVKTEFMQII